MTIICRFIFLGVCAVLGLGSAAYALDRPTGAPILTISGKIATTNVGAQAVFDRRMLESLPQHSFTTTTPWHQGPVQFTGPLLADVLAAVRASGTNLRATALNAFKTLIPVSDATRHPVLMAHSINGKSLSVRDKGPLFVIYPFDTDAELRSPVYYNRSIWQLQALEIE
jgi:hypothetical protein